VPEFAEFFSALADRNWPLVAAIGLTFIVFFIRGIAKEKIPTKFLPYITLGVAVISAVAGRMIQYISESKPWWHGLIHGVVEGFSVALPAMGWWSSVVKHVPISGGAKESPK